MRKQTVSLCHALWGPAHRLGRKSSVNYELVVRKCPVQESSCPCTYRWRARRPAVNTASVAHQTVGGDRINTQLQTHIDRAVLEDGLR